MKISFSAGLVLIASTALAQPPTKPLFSEPSKDPFSKIFRSAVQPVPLNPTSMASKPQPKVVCGMTIVTPDAGIDPKFAAPPPPGNFTLKVVKPQVCTDDEAKSNLVQPRR